MALPFQALGASPHKIDEYHWEGVDRIVAIGDLHGDYGNYMATLQAADIVDTRGRWIAGKTHLVQTGDIPDRGPDTTRIIDHMEQLARQARKRGGHVHNLMGNHEAMNVTGDLRYVSAGEYEAFITPKSASLRDRYFAKVLEHREADAAGTTADLPDGFRTQWEKTHPLGWVEHRLAWNPDWNPEGKYFQWVMQTKVAVQINDLVFVHGGLSGAYCRNTLESLTTKAREALRGDAPMVSNILDDEHGPLWYRGLSGGMPVAPPEAVAALLRQHGARRIVVGHTPTGGAIWPRYQGRVVQIDTGISAAYGGHVAYLEATPDGLFAGYPSGRIRLPDDDAGRAEYLEQVIALQSGDPAMETQLRALLASPEQAAAAPGSDEQPTADAPTAAAVAEPLPICGISP